MLFVEDFDSDWDQKFLNEAVKPYFKTLFEDIAMRTKKVSKNCNTIEDVAFYEYSKLPGIINDRFFSTFEKTENNSIDMKSFIEGLTCVYLSSLDDKLHLTFNM